VFNSLDNAVDLNNYLANANLSPKQESSSQVTSDGLELPVVLQAKVPAAKDRSRSTTNFIPGLNLAALRTANGLENIEELATMVKSFVSSQAL